MSLDFLRQIGYIWDKSRFPSDLITDDGHSKAVQQMVAFLTAKQSRSVVVSGEPGVGKTTLIDLACKELDGLGWKIFVSGATDLVAGQRYIGDLEQQVRTLSEFLQKSKEKWLWIVPRFHELYYIGKHEYSPMGILDMILPHVEAGRITVIGETQPRHYERVLQFRPALQIAMEQIRIQPEDTAYAIALAEKWIATKQNKTAWKEVDKHALKEAAWMAKQYLGNKEEPGNLMDFLKLTEKHFQAENSEGRPKTGIQQGDFISALSGMTGLPLEILDDRQKLDLGDLSKAFQDQVLGQEEAVDVLTERIAMIKAGLTDPSRPAGVFLFVGPTGTGKTEIAKTLADFMFGSPDRMIRLDMSEFQTADSMYRIFGGLGGDSIALVDQIRKNPFSVILLDEFEKSHPKVWDLFLQVFDDGRMTDPQGDTADFRHAIIIMTSNLGAGISSGAVPGFKPDAPGGYQVDKVFKELEGVFRPEFLNRIDRVVAFKPLSRGVVRKILRNELKKVLQRRGFRQRKWAVEWEDSALSFLMDKGFSETLGARPMKRAIEQYLLAPLAIAIVNHQFPEGE
ncbi:MAG: ATP-dependent Clp protease ATP-binding subunit ClpC, partial [Planctomycetota bacterium]